MKILVSAYRCSPAVGGEPGRSWMWVQSYLKLGYEVWCIANQWDREVIEQHLSPGDHCHFVFLEVPAWLEKIYVNTLGVYVHYLVWQRYAYHQAARLQQEQCFDFVHHISYGSPQLGSSLWRLQIPMVFGPIGGGQFPPPSFKKYFYSGWKEEQVRKWLSRLLMLFNLDARRTLKQARLVMAVNRETADLAKAYGSQRVDMFLDSGLNERALPELLPEKPTSPQLNILWVGRLLPRKGLPLALEALSLVSADVPFRLTILGDGPLGAYVTEWLERYQLQDRVDWQGQVPWDTVKSYYLKSDVFLFCSLRESFGAQLLEAMAFGLPVIALDHQGVQAFVPDQAGIKVPVTHPSETVQGIADAIAYFYQHPEERLAAGRYAYQYARQQVDFNNVKDMILSYDI